jgi:hypothetical protein
MTNVTLSVPEELHREMRAHPEVRWAEVARKAFRDHLDKLELYDHLLRTSKLTQADAARLGRGIRQSAASRPK